MAQLEHGINLKFLPFLRLKWETDESSFEGRSSINFVVLLLGASRSSDSNYSCLVTASFFSAICSPSSPESHAGKFYDPSPSRRRNQIGNESTVEMLIEDNSNSRITFLGRARYVTS